MAKSITTFLMFNGCAEQAINFYVSLFTHSKIDLIERYSDDEGGEEGTVKFARIIINGLTLMCIDSNQKHDFKFTPSISLFVDCLSQIEIEHLYKSFMEEGKALMPLDDYGFSEQFAWVTDRFGVSWQLNFQT